MTDDESFTISKDAEGNITLGGGWKDLYVVTEHPDGRITLTPLDAEADRAE
jgi:hypothetical protein